MNNTAVRTKSMIYISLFAVLIAVCAWISIPAAVPFTMQTFGVFAATGILGGKKGTAAICIYLLLGAVGLPVFSGGTSGPGILLGSTGGYMLGWILAGLVAWAAESVFGRSVRTAALSMILGLAGCYALGTAWFMAVYAQGSGPIGLWSALSMCVVPFIIPDLLKIALALVIRKRLIRFIQ